MLHLLKVKSGGCRLYSDPDSEAEMVVLDDTNDTVAARVKSRQTLPFRVHAAGVPCKDVNSFGKGLADAGPCMVAQSAWVHEGAVQHEDLGFL